MEIMLAKGKSTAFPERAKKQLAEIMHSLIRNQFFFVAIEITSFSLLICPRILKRVHIFYCLGLLKGQRRPDDLYVTFHSENKFAYFNILLKIHIFVQQLFFWIPRENIVLVLSVVSRKLFIPLPYIEGTVNRGICQIVPPSLLICLLSALIL